MNKAQVNQAFIFIFMLIIIASISIISFQLLTKGRVAACEADKANFKNNLQRLSDSWSEFGVVSVEEIRAPCSYEELCIITTEELTGGGSDYFIIEEYLELPGPERDNNIFLIKDGEAEPLGLIPEITTPDANSLCILREGSFFNVKFSGRGQRVELTEG